MYTEQANMVASSVDFHMATIAKNVSRPSVLYRPNLRLDGNKWIALYGDNLQVGVVGVGDSPDAAMFNFDEEWMKTYPDA